MSLFHTLRVVFLKSVVCFLLSGISWGMEVERDFINQINPNKNIEKKQDIITTNNEAFYIFSVGQGNAQLAVYSNFSVLYDCGSKSSSSYSKVYDLHREEYELFLKKKAEKIDIGDMDFGNDLEIKEQSRDRKNSGNSKSSGEFSDNTNTLISKIERKDLGTQIYQVLDSLSSKKLFVFLSHPDEDHINLLSSSIPNNFDVVAFLCGDWLGEGAQNKDKSNLSDPVQQILTYLFNRDQEKTWVELPYYWGYQRTWKDNDSWGLGMFQYKDILKKLTMEAKEKFNYGVNKARQQYNDIVTKYQHSNSGFKFFLDKFDTIKINTIYDNKASCKNNEDKLIWQNLINQVYQRDLLIGSFNKNNLSEVNSVIFQTLYEEIYPNSIWNKNVFFKGELVNLLKQLITKEEDWKRWNLYKSWDIKESTELNNIFIWNLNHQFSDVNSQSPIISFVMPNLVEGIDMSFVCTGDAANETFGFTNFYPHDGAFKVFNESKKNSICIRSIVVPHHGSSKNISRQMLDFFQPHILIFSAGIGMYEHPEKKTILDYSEFLKQQNYTEDLYKNFSLQTTNGLIFYEKDEGAFLYKNSNIPLKVCMISTNLFGNILVNQEGFKGQFSDIVEYPQGSNALYKVFFKERAEGREDCSHEEGELICQKEGTFWLLKSINNKKKSVEFIHYQAQKLDSELGK